MPIPLFTLFVPDYDPAIAFFVHTLGFTLLEDSPQGNNKRWVRVAPPSARFAAPSAAILLARASTPEQLAAVGNQAGGRVFAFLETDDFDRDYAAFRARGVTFLEPPRREPYGTVAVFLDLCGNRWDLIQPSAPSPVLSP